MMTSFLLIVFLQRPAFGFFRFLVASETLGIYRGSSPCRTYGEMPHPSRTDGICGNGLCSWLYCTLSYNHYNSSTITRRGSCEYEILLRRNLWVGSFGPIVLAWSLPVIQWTLPVCL